MYQTSINKRSAPCDDDREFTAPYIGMLPDESDTEEGSHLDFSHKGRTFRIGDNEDPDEVPEDNSDYYNDLAIIARENARLIKSKRVKL